MLTKKTNPNGESVTNTYDAEGRIATQTYAGENGITPTETTSYDPNGRKVSITSSAYGAQQYVYDADGRVTQSIEPSGGGLTDPAQLAYSYYPDGHKAAISVTSAHFTQANAIAYSYRIDGQLKTQTLNAFGGGTWSKQYTDMGRLTSVGGIDSQTRTYDGSGQLATYALGGGTLSYTHDSEGSVATTTMPNVTTFGNSPETETLTDAYNVRGEVVDQQYNPNTFQTFAHRHGTSTAGYLSTLTVPLPTDSDPGATQTCGDSPDYINGVRVDLACSPPAVQYGAQSYPQGSDDRYSFDATGRAIQHVSSKRTFSQWVGPPPGNRVTAKNTTKKTTTTSTYDAENHLYAYHPVLVTTTTDANTNQTTTFTEDHGTTTVGWGPNGHPVQVLNLWQAHAALPPLTLHWDGDMMLFVTDSSGTVIDFKVGLDGEAVPTDTTYNSAMAFDRDAAGVVIQYRNPTGYSAVTPLDPSDLSGPSMVGSSPGFVGAGAGSTWWFPYMRSDGFSGLAVQINGVRGFDSTLGGWTTPDAFEGDVRDPASQQRYMWNRDNPIDYSDPSGYVFVNGGTSISWQLILQRAWEFLNTPVPASWPRPPGFGCTCGAPEIDPQSTGSRGDTGPRSSDHAAMSMNNRDAGGIIGWGKRQEGAAQTTKMAQEMTPARVQEFIDKGLDKQTVEGLLKQYEAAIAKGNAQVNSQVKPRADLMQAILKNWPK